MLILFFITLTTGLLLMLLGYKMSKKIKITKYKVFLSILFYIFCIPGTLFVAFSPQFINEPIWSINFRCINNIEILSAFWGLFFGFVTVKPPYKTGKVIVRWSIFNKYIYMICVLLIMAPFLNRLLPKQYSKMHNNWSNGVCLQTTGRSCVAASVATVFKYYGFNKTELQVAKAMNTSMLGTQIYEPIRYARKNGLQATCSYEKDLAKIKVPSILQVKLCNYMDHAITLIGKEKNAYIIGDPLDGRTLLTKEQFYKQYIFGGFVISFNK